MVESAEGLPIHAVLEYPQKFRGLVIVLHGFKGFKDWGFFPWLSERFADAGLAACRFDFSRNGVGNSGDQFDRLDLFEHDTYSQQLSDLTSVVRAVESQHVLGEVPISLFGHSRGGAIALLGAQSIPRLRSVATWSAIASLDRWDGNTKRQWRERGYLDVPNARTGQNMRISTALLDDFERNRDRLDVLGAVRRLDVPLLVVHGARDETVGLADAKQLAAGNLNSSMVVIESGSHTFGAIHPLVHVPQELKLATQVTTAFLLNASRD